MSVCDVCGAAARYRIQFRESERSIFPYCAGHARPFLREGFRPTVYRIRYAT